MKMLIYCLYHRHVFDTGEHDDKIIGYYTSYQLALEAKARAVQLLGFRDQPENFHVEILDLPNFQGRLFVTFFTNYTREIEVEVTFGYYATREEAQRVADRMIKQKPYCDDPDDLQVEDVFINKDQWVDGFVTVHGFE